MTETPNPNIVDADTLTGEMHPIRRCVLAIGSNLGERLSNLQGAVNTLADTPEVWLTAVSPVYETAPVGAPDGSLFAQDSSTSGDRAEIGDVPDANPGNIGKSFHG